MRAIMRKCCLQQQHSEVKVGFSGMIVLIVVPSTALTAQHNFTTPDNVSGAARAGTDRLWFLLCYSCCDDQAGRIKSIAERSIEQLLSS